MQYQLIICALQGTWNFLVLRALKKFGEPLLYRIVTWFADLSCWTSRSSDASLTDGRGWAIAKENTSEEYSQVKSDTKLEIGLNIEFLIVKQLLFVLMIQIPYFLKITIRKIMLIILVKKQWATVKFRNIWGKVLRIKCFEILHNLLYPKLNKFNLYWWDSRPFLFGSYQIQKLPYFRKNFECIFELKSAWPMKVKLM